MLALGLIITSCQKEDDEVLYETYCITFEDAPEHVLAGETAYGENYYQKGFEGYLDKSGLHFGLNDEHSENAFMNGGVGVSQWNDMIGNTFQNQFSVYYNDPSTQKGGVEGSATFAVGYGMRNDYGGRNPQIKFADEAHEQVVESAYFMNNTYTALVMKKGNDFARALSYEKKDWFKWTAIGYNSKGEKTGEVEIFLADFRAANAKGIVEDWIKVSLESLGAVNRIEFIVDGTDKGEYGVNTPTYFCVDNITLRVNSK